MKIKKSKAPSARSKSSNYRELYRQRAQTMVKQLTLEEKLGQMLHESVAVPRLNIPAYNWWNECLHGVARAGLATVFPQAIGLAATFNALQLKEIASIIADEARAKHHAAIKNGYRGQYFGLTYWTPNINIFRDPRWGRGQETYGEDPFLTARLGVAFVGGLQGDNPAYLKLVATPKHFAVHSGPEPMRHGFNAVVSPRDLRETYLPAFQACVQEAGAASVMGAYNRVNGEPCCGSTTLLEKILRQEWGFDGFVVSDCGAICDFHNHHHVTKDGAASAAMAVRAGCELNCGVTYHHLQDALQRGLITEAEIDRAVVRLLEARLRLGMFDAPRQVPFARIPLRCVASAAHRRVALTAARESIVLLKNDQAILPLARHLNSIAVVGPTAHNLEALYGNYTGFARESQTILEGIISAAGAATQVHYVKGCDLAGSRPLNTGELNGVIPDADLIIAVLGYTPTLEGEEFGDTGDAAADGGGDRLRIGLPGRQLELLQALHAAGKPVILVLTGGSPIEIRWAKDHIPAILMAWYPGERGARAIADVLWGRYNPAGRLPVTFVKSLEQLPPFEDYKMAGRTYRFMTDEPLYPFGYGLSYTTFKYEQLKLSRSNIRPGQSVQAQVHVVNTGPRAGDEVVQLYVRDVQASVPVPRHHLAGFQRVHIPIGGRRMVKFDLKPEHFSAFRDDGEAFIEPGTFLISVGGGQPDAEAAQTINCRLTITEG